ncbi:MAG TPA: hypothetical protein ENN61_04795, partial [Bacteroidaceae bacterium]|nr:hypothetical protein [Bacteroidaceae bacterium]
MIRATCITVVIAASIWWNSALNGQIINPDKGFVFNDTSIPRIDITISEADLASLYEDPFSNTEYPVHFRISRDGIAEEVQNVGLRFRGNTSRGKQKKSFKVSFNTFVIGGNFHGLEKLNLNAETNDPSMMRSKLSWELFRYMGIPASRVNHVLLYINDNFFGVYINT